jgi:hypothetical protein
MYGAIIIPFHEFRKMQICNLASNGKFLKERRIAMKVITGYAFDNDHNYIDYPIVGALFSFYMGFPEFEPKTKHKTCVINIWSLCGDHLFGEKITVKSINDTISADCLKRIDKCLNDYMRGFINCSDCKKQIKKSDIAGRYFAGVYCKDCWEGKWEATEAKETYN